MGAQLGPTGDVIRSFRGRSLRGRLWFGYREAKGAHWVEVRGAGVLQEVVLLNLRPAIGVLQEGPPGGGGVCGSRGWQMYE